MEEPGSALILCLFGTNRLNQTLISLQMESVFSRFDSYDFAADQRFQDGLKTLQDTGTGNELLDMKLFFYNRYVLLLCSLIC